MVAGLDSGMTDGGSNLVDGNMVSVWLPGEVGVGGDTAAMVCRVGAWFSDEVGVGGDAAPMVCRWTGSASILKRRPSGLPAEAGERTTSGR